MKNITDINLESKRVLIRVDFNIPIENGIIQSDFRIKAVKETIEYCLENNCSIVLMSHLGRPNGVDVNYSLKPLVKYLKNLFNVNIYFSNDCISDESINISMNMKNKEIHLLENLRFYKEEVENDEVFSYRLSSHADIYINDAFGTSHRQHASNSLILKYFNIKAIGFLMQKEFDYLKNIFKDDSKPLIIVGGAKISTKINMIKKFITNSSNILIGGGMAFTFLKAKGINIGSSLVEDSMIDTAKEILDIASQNQVNIILPVDVVCGTDFSSNTDIDICSIDNINDNYMGLDIGPETTMIFEMLIGEASSVIWNGPVGAFELSPFSTGTHAIAHCISQKTVNEGLISIIGGGDTANAIMQCELENTYSHVSTGGGASLELLSGKELKIFKSWRDYE